jgi:hypothetical protein
MIVMLSDGLMNLLKYIIGKICEMCKIVDVHLFVKKKEVYTFPVRRIVSEFSQHIKH